MNPLALSNDERAQRKYYFVDDKFGRETILGLDRSESERYINLTRMLGRKKTDAQDYRYLDGRYQRAVFFWKLSENSPGDLPNIMNEDDAFNAGYEAFKHSKEFSSFTAMIVKIHDNHRRDALYGWLQAFDDKSESFPKS